MYHIIGIFLFLLSLLSVFYDDLRKSKVVLFIVIISLFVLSSIRYDIGTDYQTYFTFFELVKPFSFNSIFSSQHDYFEPLFQYTSSILKHFFKNPIYHFSFWAFVTLLFFWVGIKRESNHYIMSLFILYCNFYVNYTFNGIRQGIVMAIFIYSIRYIINRDLMKVLFVSLVSSLIHSTGILILFSYFISFIRFRNRLTLILILTASIITWQTGLGEKIFTFIALRFQDFIPNLGWYAKIFLYDHNFGQALQRVLLLVPLLYYYPLLSKDSKFSKLFSIYFFGVIIYFMFGFFGLFIARINMFFRILEIILIPILYQRIQNKNQKIIVQVFIMIWCFVILSWVYSKEAYYPFKTIFGSFL